jgi:acetylornithine deacetylase
MNIVELATKLVSFDTVSKYSSTCDMAEFICEYLSKLGFEIGEIPYLLKGDKRVNVIARINGKQSRVALSGHMDTVGYKGDWEPASEALILTPNIGRYYGRGIADMKLFLAIAMKVGEKVSTEKLDIPLALCFTSDEEIGCVGAKKLRHNGIHVADSIIIGEPTEMVPVYSHKGYVYISIELLGGGGHSYDPANGVSVVPALVKVLSELAKLEALLKGGVNDKKFDPSYPTINVGVVTTDQLDRNVSDRKKIKSEKNKIPKFCRIELEVRSIPGQNGKEIANVVEGLLGKQIGKVEVKIQLERSPSQPLATSINSKLVQIASRLSGYKPVTVCFNTEAGVLSGPGVEAIVWGPGSIKQAHSKSEFVDKKFFSPEIIDLYVKAISQLCQKGDAYV